MNGERVGGEGFSAHCARSQAIQMDRLRPVRATNPHAPSSQGSHPLALLSLAEDSLALNSSRVDCPSAWTGLLHLATSSTCQRCRRRGEADDARHPRTPKCICAQRLDPMSPSVVLSPSRPMDMLHPAQAYPSLCRRPMSPC